MATTHHGWTKNVWPKIAIGSKTRETMTSGQVKRRERLYGTSEDRTGQQHRSEKEVQ